MAEPPVESATPAGAGRDEAEDERTVSRDGAAVAGAPLSVHHEKEQLMRWAAIQTALRKIARRARDMLHRLMRIEPAVLFFQWRPEDERDEIVVAIAKLKAECELGDQGRAHGVMPLIEAHTCTCEDPTEFARQLEAKLASMPNLQVLYLSAHGLDDAIARDREGRSKLAFNDLGPYLARGLAKANTVTAVFGLCFALSARSFLITVLPSAIDEAYGFTATPEASDVAALIAGVLADEVTLMSNATKANQEVFGSGIPFEQAGPAIEALVEKLNAVVDEFDDSHEPEFFVTGSKGASVKRLRRGEDGAWETVTSVAVPGRVAERSAEGEPPPRDDDEGG